MIERNKRHRRYVHARRTGSLGLAVRTFVVLGASPGDSMERWHRWNEATGVKWEWMPFPPTMATNEGLTYLEHDEAFKALA